MDQPLISVVTPTYNHEAFIGECITSVRSQSYINWEMIIIDDESTDRTSPIVQSFVQEDTRIRFIQQAHKGVGKLSETYNRALELCKGEWVGILEGDDYWLPGKLAAQVPHCRDQVVINYGCYLDKLEDSTSVGLRPPFSNTIPMEQFIPILLMHQSYLIAVTALFKKEALNSIGGFHQDGSPAAVDMATLMHLIELHGMVHYVPENLGVWRHHPQQSTATLGVELARFNANQVFDYLDKHSDQACLQAGIHKAEVMRARNDEIASACFTAIRHKLRDQSREGALPLIQDLWRYGRSKRKLEAVYSMMAYILHTDIEFPLRIAERFGPKESQLNL